MEKLKLKIEDLKVETFNTSALKTKKGTVLANTGDHCIACETDPEPSCQATSPGMGCGLPTIDDTCGDNNTCVNTCGNSCGGTCDHTCNQPTCDTCDIGQCTHPVTNGQQLVC